MSLTQSNINLVCGSAGNIALFSNKRRIVNCKAVFHRDSCFPEP